MVPAAYRELFGLRPMRLPLVASIVGRLPLGAGVLAVILLVRAATGSFADAGLVEALFAVGAGVGLPFLGRLVDRVGQARVLIPAALLNATALLALVLAANGGAAVAALAVLAALAGASQPPLSPCIRGLWSAMLDDPGSLQSAYALDAVVLETAFIAGPLIAAGLAAGISPGAAVIGAATLSISGAFAFAASAASRSWRGGGRGGDWAGALRSNGIWVLVAASAGFGFANGALALTLTAFGGQHGATEIVGPLISIQALASMAGGIWYGARRHRSPPEDRYPRLNLLLALGFAPLVIAPAVPVMGALMILAGIAIAPVAAVEYVLVDRVAPSGTSTEAFGWVITATVFGSAVGSALGGAVVNGGDVRLGFLVAFGGAALAWMASVIGRPALRLAAEPV